MHTRGATDKCPEDVHEVHIPGASGLLVLFQRMEIQDSEASVGFFTDAACAHPIHVMKQESEPLPIVVGEQRFWLRVKVRPPALAPGLLWPWCPLSCSRAPA